MMSPPMSQMEIIMDPQPAMAWPNPSETSTYTNMPIATRIDSSPAPVTKLSGLVAECGHDATQEQVDFVVFAERVERLAAHETVIGVVGYRLGTHPLEHLVEGFGGGALEPCVLLACGTHSVDNLVAVAESVDELVDRVHIVLQVGVHGDGGVAA